MNNEELLKVLELISNTEPSKLSISQRISDIDYEYVYKLILLFVQGNKERINLYINHKKLGVWSKLSQCILDIPSIINNSNQDLEILLLLKKRVRDIINVIVTGTFDENHENFNIIEDLPFKDYIPELIDLYESLLIEEYYDGHDIIKLLRSSNPVDTFIELCTKPGIYSFYYDGVINKYFPSVTWELLQQVVNQYYQSDLIGVVLDDGYYLLIKPEDLEPYQLEWLISKGCSYLIYEAIKQGNINISNTEIYKERIEEVEEWLRLERLEEQYPSIESIASNWYSISQKDREYLYNRNSREYTHVGESPLRIRSMNLALVMAGVHEIKLTGGLPDYYNEKDLNEM